MSDTTDRPRFTVFAGPNGSGKSTAYVRFLEAGLRSGEYLNPDDIARALRTREDAGAADLAAGREVIRRTRTLIASREPFVRETTLSGREIERSIQAAKAAGYRVAMVFVAIGSPDLTAWRIAVRVSTGGHDIAREDQARRLPRSLANASRIAGLVDAAYFLDNTERQHTLVAAVSGGTITFLDAQAVAGGQWVERATTGLAKARRMMSRDAALASLREAEGLSDRLEVRDQRGEYATAGRPRRASTTDESPASAATVASPGRRPPGPRGSRCCRTPRCRAAPRARSWPSTGSVRNSCRSRHRPPWAPR